MSNLFVSGKIIQFKTFTYFLRKVIILHFSTHDLTSAMTATTIADIYDAIKHCNGEYCSICFRPSSVRKLVTPVYIIQLRFSKYSKVDNVHMRNRLKVCYMCEAMAAKTVRFQQVVTLAASVEAMLTLMTDELRDAMVPRQFFPNTYVTQEMNRTILRMKEVEAALQNTMVPQYACSHVLLVSSDTPRTSRTNTDATRLNSTSSVGTRPSGTRPNKSATLPSLLPSNKPIIVEDDPPLQGGLVQASCVPGHLQLQVKEHATGNIVLHPIIIGTNGKMYVPSLKVEVKSNETLRSVSDAELFEYANVSEPPPHQLPLKPAPRKTNETTENKINTMLSNYVDFIQKQSEYNEVIENRDPLEQDADDTTLNKKPRLESEKSKRDGVSNGIKDDVGDPMKPVKTYATKKPVLQMHKVMDWEDKIPMDVISFMDATDPNPNERIMQPNQPNRPKSPPTPTMGVISDVRTIDDNENDRLNNNEDIFDNVRTIDDNENNRLINNEVISDNEPDDNDVVLVEDIECIDLC